MVGNGRRATLIGALLWAVALVGTGCGEDQPSTAETSGSSRPAGQADPPDKPGWAAARDGIARLRVQARIPLPSDTRVGLAAQGDVLWAKTKEGLLLEIDARDNVIVGQTRLADIALVASEPQNPVATGAGSVWTADLSTGLVYRVNPASKQVVATVRVSAHDLEVAFGAVWAPEYDSREVVRINPENNRVDARIPANGPTSVAAGDGSVWIVENKAGGAVLRVDPDTTKVIESIPMPTPGAQRATFGEGALWVTTGHSNTVVRIDPTTNRAVAEIILPPSADAATNLTTGAGSVWVTADGALLRIDPDTNTIIALLEVRVDERVCGEPVPSTRCVFDVAYADGSIWVTYALEKALYRVASG